MTGRGKKQTCPRQSRRSLCLEHGITGIELLIVLATLGVLVGTVAMSLDDMDQCARNRVISQEMEALRGAIDMYNARDLKMHGAPPIPAQEAPGLVTTSDPSVAPYFQRYLLHSTRFKYAWQAGGAQLRVAEQCAVVCAQ